MALFAISDLHLSLGTDKPMDVFGKKWENYEARLRENWQRTIRPEDVVLLCGDHSWATYLEHTYEDFSFIQALNGKKYLLKGNHDYWWTTLKKQRDYCAANGFDSIDFLHNNCVRYRDIAVCGTRGWQLTCRDAEDCKIHSRELGRLEESIRQALKTQPRALIAALHYPPDEAFRSVLERYHISLCLFGHLHGRTPRDYADRTENGIAYKLMSCDWLDFQPYKITD